MHTKTPWKVFSMKDIKDITEIEDANGYPVIAWPGFDSSYFAKFTDRENARFIVTACNAYDALLAQRAQLVEALKRLSNAVEMDLRNQDDNNWDPIEELSLALAQARAAIAAIAATSEVQHG